MGFKIVEMIFTLAILVIIFGSIFGPPVLANWLKHKAKDQEGLGDSLRSEMTVTRVIAGGPPLTEKTATVVDEVSVADVDPKLFEPPR